MDYTERIISKGNDRAVSFNAESLAAVNGCSRTIRRNNDLVCFRTVLANIANGLLTALDHEIINITASMGYVTENTLKTYIRMAGIPFTSDEFITSEERLLENQLIYVSDVVSDREYKVYSADNYGSQVARKNNVYCKFEAFAISEPAETVIKRAAIAQLGAAYLASSKPTALMIRPLIVAADGAVRPSAVIELEGNSVIVEVVRRDETWKAELLEKKGRLESALAGKGDNAFLLFCGEDEEMNREIYELLGGVILDTTLLFTEDKLLSSDDFKHSIYYFDGFGNTVTAEFADRVLKSE